MDERNPMITSLEELQTYLDTYYLDAPLMAQLSFDKTQKFYGPFENGKEAYEWFTTHVPMSVNVSWHGLRNPYLKRETHDFYAPLFLENQEREYDHTIKES